MGYDREMENRGRTLEEMSGRETVRDSRGREWLIRVFPLGELDRFHGALAEIWMDPGPGAWARFFRKTLMSPEPGLLVRLRRALGLPDFTTRAVAGLIPLRDARGLRDRVVRANLDMGYEEFAARCEELLKKKSAETKRISAQEE